MLMHRVAFQGSAAAILNSVSGMTDDEQDSKFGSNMEPTLSSFLPK